MQEVNWRLKAIFKRKNSDASFTAAVHGVKLKGSSSNKNVECKLSKEQENKLDKLMEARMKQNG